jgi:hypothetical protein
MEPLILPAAFLPFTSLPLIWRLRAGEDCGDVKSKDPMIPIDYRDFCSFPLFFRFINSAITSFS